MGDDRPSEIGQAITESGFEAALKAFLSAQLPTSVSYSPDQVEFLAKYAYRNGEFPSKSQLRELGAGFSLSDIDPHVIELAIVVFEALKLIIEYAKGRSKRPQVVTKNVVNLVFLDKKVLRGKHNNEVRANLAAALEEGFRHDREQQP